MPLYIVDIAPSYIICRHFFIAYKSLFFNYFSHSLGVLKKALLDPKLKRAPSMFSSVDFEVLGLLLKLRLCFELVVCVDGVKREPNLILMDVNNPAAGF